MDVETVFRATFGIKKEQDMVGLIEAAVSVAALIVPDKLKKHRSRIIKLLFDEDPANSTDLFSDDELGSDIDGDDDNDKDKLNVAPKNVVCTSPEIKKTVELSQVTAAAPPTPLTSSEKSIVGRQDKLMEATTKRMVGSKYHEEAEKKSKRKIEQREVDFPEPKKHCNDRSKAAKPPSRHVRIQRVLSRMKSEHFKPKPKYGLVL